MADMTAASESASDPGHAPQAPRRGTREPAGDWVKNNLFNTWYNSLITVVIALGGLWATWAAIRFVVDADWAIVRNVHRIFMIGQFPRDELWRPWVSGSIVVGTVGLVSAALARSAYEDAIEKDLPAERPTWLGLIRRFWPIVMMLVFFVSFARTLPPYLGIAGILALFVVTREVGWRLGAGARAVMPYVGGVLAIVSMMVLAGTSRLGGFTIGLVLAALVASEMGRREVAMGTRALIARAVVAVIIVAASTFAVDAIGFDGFGWEEWGGFHLSYFVAVVGIGLGLPFGVLLALGRRSQLPIIRSVSVAFIEFVRGVPLISLLLFSSLMLRFFFPPDATIPADLTMAMIVVTGFSAAYIAEIVRGGLQSVPKGQTEAAQAAGMSPASVQRLIVLPQALRNVIPAMVGQFISLFKDTSLLFIIALPTPEQVVSIANAQPDFFGKGLADITYLFIAVGYWAVCYTMSKESRRLETKLGVGVR